MEERVRRTFGIVLVLVLLISIASVSQEKRAFTVEDLWNVQRVSGPVMSPDEKWLAVTVSSYDMEENKGTSDIWLLSTDGAVVRQLTTSTVNDSAPVWSPCGKKLAFISNRNGYSSQVYVIDPFLGEAEQITDIPTGAGAPRWSPDGTKIYFISSVWPDCESDECLQKRLDEMKDSKVKAHVVDFTLFRYWNRYVTDGRRPMLFVHDFESGEHRNVMAKTGKTFDIRGAGTSSYAISPDGSEIALVINNVENPGLDSDSDIFIMSSEGGELRNITADNPAGDSNPKYSPDGRYLSYSMSRTPLVPEYDRIALYDRSMGETRVLTEGFEYSPGSVVWSSDSAQLIFTAGVRGRSPVYSISATGGEVQLQFEGHSMSSLQLSPDGTTLYFSRQATDLPPTIFKAALDGSDEIQLSHFNDELIAGIAWHTVEVHSFTGAAGDTVEMFVLKPADFDPARKYALVHLIHGGPHGSFNDGFHFRWNSQLFAAPGYVAAMVNFHGSSGYGQDFFDSIAGAEADKPYADIMAATDYLLGLGFIDENRMAAGGGSYGGYLTNWLATQTDRFACLFTHAGGFNHHGMFASDSPRFRERRWGGYPWLHQENTDRQSPNRFAANVKTPTMVIHGELDYRVVVTQGIEFYNTLQIMGIPSRLLLYPDEGHWIQKPQNARLWWNEIHSWLNTYIGEKGIE
jgi:dipeptidyl aminopeptidase/acylaminoacyl peptidase